MLGELLIKKKKTAIIWTLVPHAVIGGILGVFLYYKLDMHPAWCLGFAIILAGICRTMAGRSKLVRFFLHILAGGALSLAVLLLVRLEYDAAIEWQFFWCGFSFLIFNIIFSYGYKFTKEPS